MSNKILVSCAYGTDDIEKATVAFIVASASAASDNKTVVFLTGEAVRLAAEGGADGHQDEGYQEVKEFLDATIENDGSLWVCPACAGVGGGSAVGRSLSRKLG